MKKDNASLFQIIRKSFSLLNRQDQRKMKLVLLLQVTMSLLDLVGVALFGFIGALAVAGVQSNPNGEKVEKLLTLLNIDDLSLQLQTSIIAVMAVLLLLFRTLLSIMLVRRTLRYLSNKGAQISTELVSKFLNSGYWLVKESSIQETIYATSYGVRVITLGIIGNFLTLISDVALLSVLTVGLFVISWQMTLVTSIGFGLVGFLLYQFLHKRSKNLGSEESIEDIGANELLSEIIKTYKEMFVKNRLSFYVEKISIKRYRLSSILADLSFIPLISKYVLESAVLVGVLVVASMQFLVSDAKNAVATLAVFMAAGTRIAPAVLRTQQGLLQIKTNSGIAYPTFELIDRAYPTKYSGKKSVLQHTEAAEKHGKEIILNNINFHFPDSKNLTLKNISLKIASGESVAIVGPSGAGKTTLVDLLIGISEPTEGSIEIFGYSPFEYIRSHPGDIAYVPQDIVVSTGTFRSNIELGFPSGTFKDEDIWLALEKTELSAFVASHPKKLDSTVGENGGRLSGGQKQRLGFARALVGNPKILILDEATSSLDLETEESLSKFINSLKGNVTVISVAHRLRTILNASKIVYLENGFIVAEGNFEEIKTKVPNFEKQLKLIGLDR